MGSKRTRRRNARVRGVQYKDLRTNLVLTCMGHIPPAQKLYSPLRAENLPEIREEIYSGSPILATITCDCGVSTSAVYRDGTDATYAKITHAVHCIGGVS